MHQIHRLSHSLIVVMTIVTAVVLLAVTILISGMVQSGLSNFENYVISRHYAETVSTGALINQDLDALYTMVFKSLSDTTLNKLRLYMANNIVNYRYLEFAKLLESQLFSVETSIEFVESLEILLPDAERIITSSSVVRFSDQDYGVNSHLEKELAQSGQYITLSNDSLVFYDGRYAGVGQYKNDVFIRCRISRLAMTRYLSKYDSGIGSLSLFVFSDGLPELFAYSGQTLSAEDNASIARLISGAESGTANYVSDGGRYLITWASTALLPIKLCSVTPMEVIDDQMAEYRGTVVLVSTLTLLLLGTLIYMLNFMVVRPVLNVKQALERVENGDLSTRLGQTWSSEFQQIYGQFDRMTEHLQHLIEREYELQLLNNQAEIKQLRYQINPHFLYNSYFNLRAMLVDEEYDQATELADLMGRYLRYITTSAREYALLTEEFQHAAAYMEIQRIRFGERITIRMDEIPDWASRLEVPRLILQPLLENAFEHGVKEQLGQAIIAIHLEKNGADLIIIVEDNGANTTDEVIERVRHLIAGDTPERTESVALVNIHKRLTLLYAPGSGLFVGRSSLGGFRSEIRMKGVFQHAENPDC